MPNWSVWIYVKASGRCPFDKWRESKTLTTKDVAAIDAKVTVVEATSGTLPPETLKELQGTNLHELKVRGHKKQLRPLCFVDTGRRIIILCGAIEKDWSLPDGDILTGENLRQDYLDDKGKIRPYFEDPDDLE